MVCTKTSGGGKYVAQHLLLLLLLLRRRCIPQLCWLLHSNLQRQPTVPGLALEAILPPIVGPPRLPQLHRRRDTADDGMAMDWRKRMPPPGRKLEAQGRPNIDGTLEQLRQAEAKLLRRERVAMIAREEAAMPAALRPPPRPQVGKGPSFCESDGPARPATLEEIGRELADCLAAGRELRDLIAERVGQLTAPAEELARQRAVVHEEVGSRAELLRADLASELWEEKAKGQMGESWWTEQQEEAAAALDYLPPPARLLFLGGSGSDG